MRVLLTGADGYIGCLLGPYLMDRGHEVVGLDTGLYRDGWLYRSDSNRVPPIINKDIRNITADDVAGFDAVAHLAELSNDPLGQHDPRITYAINHQGTVDLAKHCKSMGVERFVYTSSCSVYGVADDDVCTEESATNPQTAYAECKQMVERDVSALADADFCPTFLRNATAYGASPRMRFDIVLNNLAGFAWTEGEIKMTSDGTPWRPLVHVLDICQAVERVLAARTDVVHNEVFNVGATDANYRIRDVAEIVADAFPDCTTSFGPSDQDNRSYRVSFDKINNLLPGFKCCWDARSGAAQLHDVFSTIDMGVETFEFRPYTRLKQLEYLLRTKQIDAEFFWETREV